MITSNYVLGVRDTIDNTSKEIEVFDTYKKAINYIKSNKLPDGKQYELTRIDYDDEGNEISEVGGISTKFAED